jgi:RND superfamily putative drug exporter
VAYGIKATAGVVTAAATVMVAVFAIFVTLSTVDMKQAGFGLATAVLSTQRSSGPCCSRRR